MKFTKQLFINRSTTSDLVGLSRMRGRFLISCFWSCCFWGVVVFGLCGCDTFEHVPAGRIKIKNDFGGKEWSTIEVSARGSRYVLEARQSVLLPVGTTMINFYYQGPKERRYYTVMCPERPTGGVLIKLIDVDSGRISGDCKTVSVKRRKY
ncbi:MAG: hypothetical protein GX589_02350 [Deltaproteobacteria bacterium]|nr:hypothetical protein [Deltaproteobacteria bacterium]